jgi:hypothetical protein
MKYKNAVEIWTEEVKNKGLFIPRLGFQDEIHFNMLNLAISELSEILNEYPRWRQFLMFKERKLYRNTEKELLDFISFWAFKEELSAAINVSKFRKDGQWDQ